MKIETITILKTNEFNESPGDSTVVMTEEQSTIYTINFLDEVQVTRPQAACFTRYPKYIVKIIPGQNPNFQNTNAGKTGELPPQL